MPIQNIETEYKPWGGAAGIIESNNTYNTEMANRLTNERSALENMVKQKEAAFAQDEMNNPILREMSMKGMIGENQSKVATGQFDTDTMQSRIKSQLADYAAKVPKAELEQEIAENTILLRKLQQLEGFGNQTGYDGLEFTTGAMRAAQDMGAPPQMVQAFQQADPQQRAQMIKTIRENLERSLTELPAILQEKSKKTHEHDLDLVKAEYEQGQGNYRARLQTKATVDAAKAGAKSLEAQVEKQLRGQVVAKEAQLLKLIEARSEWVDGPIERKRVDKLLAGVKNPTPAQRDAARRVIEGESSLTPEIWRIQAELTALKTQVGYPTGEGAPVQPSTGVIKLD